MMDGLVASRLCLEGFCRDTRLCTVDLTWII